MNPTYVWRLPWRPRVPNCIPQATPFDGDEGAHVYDSNDTTFESGSDTISLGEAFYGDAARESGIGMDHKHHVLAFFKQWQQDRVADVSRIILDGAFWVVDAFQGRCACWIACGIQSLDEWTQALIKMKRSWEDNEGWFWCHIDRQYPDDRVLTCELRYSGSNLYVL